MSHYIIQRLLMTVFILFLASALVFVATEVLPGDVASNILGRRATPESLATLREKLDLNSPPLARYLDWLGGIVRGDWGESLALNVPVLPLLLERSRNSILLMLAPFGIAVPLGILLGLLSGLFRNSWFDSVISIVTLAMVSFPEFVVGTALIIVFAQQLSWFPATSMLNADTSVAELVNMLVLPTLTLLMSLLAHITRYTRISVIEVLRNDYIRTAHAKGLSPRIVIWRHMLQNTILPVLPIIVLMFGYLMGSLVVIETLFAYPGLGRLLLRAITTQDVPLLQALMLLFTASYALMNLIVDMLYFILNPRLRQN